MQMIQADFVKIVLKGRGIRMRIDLGLDID
jgi:hypothetical protein